MGYGRGVLERRRGLLRRCSLVVWPVWVSVCSGLGCFARASWRVVRVVRAVRVVRVVRAVRAWDPSSEPSSLPSSPSAGPASPPDSGLCSLLAGHESLSRHHSTLLSPSFVGFCSTGAGAAGATHYNHSRSRNQAGRIHPPSSPWPPAHGPPFPISLLFSEPVSPPDSGLCSLPAGHESLSNDMHRKRVALLLQRLRRLSIFLRYLHFHDVAIVSQLQTARSSLQKNHYSPKPN